MRLDAFSEQSLLDEAGAFIMHKHALTALAFPVSDPDTQIDERFLWWIPGERLISAGLTVNIGTD